MLTTVLMVIFGIALLIVAGLDIWWLYVLIAIVCSVLSTILLMQQLNK